MSIFQTTAISAFPTRKAVSVSERQQGTHLQDPGSADRSLLPLAMASSHGHIAEH